MIATLPEAEEHPARAIDPIAVRRLPARLRYLRRRRLPFECRCGFTGEHPFCIGCGVALGPDHAMRTGRRMPVTVYADQFDEASGFWLIVPVERKFLACPICVSHVLDDGGVLPPYRERTGARLRIRTLNSWRRARGLQPLGAATLLADAIIAFRLQLPPLTDT